MLGEQFKKQSSRTCLENEVGFGKPPDPVRIWQELAYERDKS